MNIYLDSANDRIVFVGTPDAWDKRPRHKGTISTIPTDKMRGLAEATDWAVRAQKDLRRPFLTFEDAEGCGICEFVKIGDLVRMEFENETSKETFVVSEVSRDNRFVVTENGCRFIRPFPTSSEWFCSQTWKMVRVPDQHR